MNELDLLEALFDLVQAGYIEVDDVGNEPRFRPAIDARKGESPQDLSVPPARDRRWCEGDYPDV